MADQMYSLLAICSTLLPQRLEENVENVLKEKQGENIERVLRTYVPVPSPPRSPTPPWATLVSFARPVVCALCTRKKRSEEAVFEEWFTFACPKFVAPIAPDYDALIGNNLVQEPFRYQLRLFLSEVRQQLSIPTLRSVMKLYTTMPIPKLATFLNTASESDCRYAPPASSPAAGKNPP